MNAASREPRFRGDHSHGAEHPVQYAQVLEPFLPYYRVRFARFVIIPLAVQLVQIVRESPSVEVTPIMSSLRSLAGGSRYRSIYQRQADFCGFRTLQGNSSGC